MPIFDAGIAHSTESKIASGALIIASNSKSNLPNQNRNHAGHLYNQQMRYLLILTMTFSPAFAGEFRDCADCPVMITIPAGSFLMGTAIEDRLIDPRTGKPATN